MRDDPLYTPELEAKVQTYQHIDKIRELLRLFANELVLRGETHDRSKLQPEESRVFAEYTPKLKSVTYGSDEYNRFLVEMESGLRHHYANNERASGNGIYNAMDREGKHLDLTFESWSIAEWNYNRLQGMNLVDLMEMWIDWYASSMRHADGDMGKSIDINEGRFGMSPELADIFRNTLRDFKDGKLSVLK